ncbi:het domain containing protein [Colletotrichum camelliae]|nr:het domain containing protein [Colletotrichum camelliae]
MRLIHTTTLHLEEFFESERPKYAILSHTWGQDEVGFQEWLEWQNGDATQRTRTEAKSGFQKIKNTCRVAREQGVEYAWVDSNCIDKKSSAELSEAINSMFAWYRDSTTCLVHLEDFVGASPHIPQVQILSKCRWMTRGWTLQELIAPTTMFFYDSSWGFIGSKEYLLEPLRSITGIDHEILCKEKDISSACIAQKMSWASNRQTTRTEDMAYCLLGLFNISMPLLYGEGNEAFRRLQEEILKVSTDQTIFAWDWIDDMRGYRGDHWVSILAPHPRAFRNCQLMKRDENRNGFREFVLTNLGLTISLPLLQTQDSTTFYGALKCNKSLKDGTHTFICIPLRTTDSELTLSREECNHLMNLSLPDRYFSSKPVSLCIPRFSEDIRRLAPSANGTDSANRLSRRPKDKAFLQIFVESLGPGQIQRSDSWPETSAYIETKIHLIRAQPGRRVYGCCMVVFGGKLTTRSVLSMLWLEDFSWVNVSWEDSARLDTGDDIESTIRRILGQALESAMRISRGTTVREQHGIKVVFGSRTDVMCLSLGHEEESVYDWKDEFEQEIKETVERTSAKSMRIQG